MATSYGYLAWEIPRIGEPGGLQSMGLQRVRNDLVTQQQKQQQRNFTPGKGPGSRPKTRRADKKHSKSARK